MVAQAISVDVKAAEKQRLTEILIERHNARQQAQEHAIIQREQLRREESKLALISTLEVQVKMKKDAEQALKAHDRIEEYQARKNIEAVE